MSETWTSTLGRVAFINCDPLYHDLNSTWNVLAAPPSWLTGHVLRRDCILAPIPAADYAKHADELVLLPDIGIGSQGEVGQRVAIWCCAPLVDEDHRSSKRFSNLRGFAQTSYFQTGKEHEIRLYWP